MGCREGFGTQPWSDWISCAVPLIPVNGCGSNSPLCVRSDRQTAGTHFLFFFFVPFMQMVSDICQRWLTFLFVFNFFPPFFLSSLFCQVEPRCLMSTPAPRCPATREWDVQSTPVIDKRFSCYLAASYFFPPMSPVLWGVSLHCVTK